MDSNTIDRERQKLGDISTPQQAQTQITVLPSRMIYDARFALLQAVEDEALSKEHLISLAIAVGWTEGLVFAWDKQSQVEAARTFQVATVNGQQKYGQQQ